MDELLAEAAARLDVMGAQLAAIVDGELTEAVTGVANAELGTPVTPDTLFQIGSTTKLHTAALVLGLADTGLVDLDRPVLSATSRKSGSPARRSSPRDTCCR